MKKLALVVILAVIMQSICFASATESDVTDEFAPNISTMDMMKAIADIMTPQMYNLPTIYNMPSFRPEPFDFLGDYADSMPIFSVDMTNKEESEKKQICLTFDSAYINLYTYRILDILDEYNAKATFFMTYEFMENNPEHVLEIIKRGHEIGNHSKTHPDLNKKGNSDVVKELWQCHQFMQNLCGVNMCLFRFPYGSYSPRTVSIVKQLGYYPIQWSCDSVDWKNISVEAITDVVLEKFCLRPGAIILFHNGADYTPDALPIILDRIKELELKPVRVSDMIYKHNFIIDAKTKRQKPYENLNINIEQ